MSEKQIYTLYIYDEFRCKIAAEYVQHELRKFFPSIRDSEIWRQLDPDMSKWFDQSPTLFPVRDFWNDIHGISMGFKLKNMVPLLTSLNISWKEQEVPLNKLWFGTFFHELKKNYNDISMNKVKQYFTSKENLKLVDGLGDHLERESSGAAYCDSYSILVMLKKGKVSYY